MVKFYDGVWQQRSLPSSKLYLCSFLSCRFFRFMLLVLVLATVFDLSMFPRSPTPFRRGWMLFSFCIFLRFQCLAVLVVFFLVFLFVVPVCPFLFFVLSSSPLTDIPNVGYRSGGYDTTFPVNIHGLHRQICAILPAVSGFGFQSFLYYSVLSFLRCYVLFFFLSTMLSLPVSVRWSLGYVTVFPVKLLGLHQQICPGFQFPPAEWSDSWST